MITTFCCRFGACPWKSRSARRVFQLVYLGQRGEANFRHLQIGLAAGCWIWDYLRRSYQAGLFLPLSGGIDSCATAVIVFSMTRLVYAAMVNDNKQVIEDARRICGEPKDSKWMPSKPEELCNKIFHTWFAMGPVSPRAYQLTESHFLATWELKTVAEKRELGPNSLRIVFNRTFGN